MEEWWSRKCNKARECTFATITADGISMLELIRGVSLTKLRQEFLIQKDPTLEKLLQIAKNWQVAKDVGVWNPQLSHAKRQTISKISQISGRASLEQIQAKAKWTTQVLIKAT